MLEWLFGTRKKLLEEPIQKEELNLLDQSLWQAPYLNRPLRERLIRWCRVFIQEKDWEGCNNFQVTTESQWIVASSAGLMVLAYDDWYFDRTKSILIYPTPYVAKEDGRSSFLQTSIPALMGEYSRAGQTIYRGPVIVNWQDIQSASQGKNNGDNLVIHEFSHQLDMINSPYADGLPPLPHGINEQLWKTSFRAEFQTARSLVEQGHRVLMNDYGLTQESEFFAVGSEYYFQIPTLLAEFHPKLFSLLNDFYQLDLREVLPSHPED